MAAADLIPWKPGQSGNPGGRPKGLQRATRELVGDDGISLAKFWVAMMENAKVPWNTRMAASMALAERGWGKAASLPEVRTDDPLELNEVELAIGGFVDDLARKREAKAARPAKVGSVANGSTNGAAPAEG